MHAYHGIRRSILAASLLLLAAGPVSAIQWVGTNGGGDGTTWTDGQNWQGGVAPASNADDAEFGDLSPDALQIITLDSSVTIDELIFSSTSSRAYTLNDNGGGEQLSIRRWNAAVGGTQTLTQNAQTLYTNANEIQVVGSDSTLIINGEHEPVPVSTAVLFQIFNNSVVMFNGEWGNITANDSRPISFQGTNGASEIILNNFNAVAESNEVHQANLQASTLLSIASDVDAGGGLDFKNTANLTLRFDGRAHAAAGTHRVYQLDSINNNTVFFVDDAPGSLVDGGVTLKVLGAFNQNMAANINFGTQADAVVEYSPTHASDPAPVEVDVNGDISGAGKVVISGTDSIVHLVGDWTHTGGTDITVATLQFGGAKTFGGSPEALGVGSLPDTGAVTITNGGTLDLDGNSETIGSLAGDGTVNLGGATLTLTEGVAPGNSIGELTFDGTGQLTLDGISIFELGVHPSSDRVTFNDAADLVLDGTLHLIDAGGLVGAVPYLLFDLNGGTVSGSFDAITGIAAEVFIEGGDVYVIIPEPASAATILLGCALLFTRKKRASITAR